MDGPPGGAPSPGQPHERVYAVQVGADGAEPGDQDLRGEGLGEDAGDERSDRHVARSADGAAPALGHAAAGNVTGRFRPHDQTPRMGDTVARRDAGAVRVARPTPKGWWCARTAASRTKSPSMRAEVQIRITSRIARSAAARGASPLPTTRGGMQRSQPCRSMNESFPFLTRCPSTSEDLIPTILARVAERHYCHKWLQSCWSMMIWTLGWSSGIS